jgi:hypothetical protein
MRKYASAIAVTALLLTAGFAAASIASGGGLRLLQTTGSTGTTSTVSHKQTLCHRTHSKKKPWVQISVDSHAVPAHLKHGDTLGACSQTQLAAGAAKKGKKKSSTSSSTSNGQSHGNSGNSKGKGNGKKK